MNVLDHTHVVLLQFYTCFTWQLALALAVSSLLCWPDFLVDSNENPFVYSVDRENCESFPESPACLPFPSTSRAGKSRQITDRYHIREEEAEQIENISRKMKSSSSSSSSSALVFSHSSFFHNPNPILLLIFLFLLWNRKHTKTRFQFFFFFRIADPGPIVACSLQSWRSRCQPALSLGFCSVENDPVAGTGPPWLGANGPDRLGSFCLCFSLSWHDHWCHMKTLEESSVHFSYLCYGQTFWPTDKSRKDKIHKASLYTVCCVRTPAPTDFHLSFIPCVVWEHRRLRTLTFSSLWEHQQPRALTSSCPFYMHVLICREKTEERTNREEERTNDLRIYSEPHLFSVALCVRFLTVSSSVLQHLGHICLHLNYIYRMVETDDQSESNKAME